MDTNLYIRHAIGSRLLLDCQQHQLPFDIAYQGKKWRITIGNVDREVYELLASNEKELNIFFTDNNGKKHWYYASDSPNLIYNFQDRTLTIVVDSKISYQG